MIVGALRITLHIPFSHSLKEKRQVIRPVLARVRNRFEVSAAEIDQGDRWQIAVLGIACVTNDTRHADEVLARVVNDIETHCGDAVVVDYQTEVLHLP